MKTCENGKKVVSLSFPVNTNRRQITVPDEEKMEREIAYSINQESYNE